MRFPQTSRVRTRQVVPSALLGALALLVLLLAAPPARANHTQFTIMQDDPQIVYTNANARNRRLNEIQSLGASILKIRVSWGALAPGGRKLPRNFNGRDPASYRRAVWAEFDAAIIGAMQRGMQVYLELGGDSPYWADHAGRGRHARRTQPNAGLFEQFAQAVATRYSGSYQGLPRVSMWGVWNEPNLQPWLTPQYRGNIPQSPITYRSLVYATYDALKASGHGNDTFLIGELLPFARSGTSNSTKVRPITFLQELACVDSRYRPYRGRAAKVRHCNGFKPLPGTGLSYHPYTLAGGPNVATPNPNDASIANLGRVSRALGLLASRGRLQSRHMRIWLTEFGFRSEPPDAFETPIARIPQYMGESEWLAYRDPNVVSYDQYPLVDDRSKISGFQSGLRFSNGRAKPGVYKAFQCPFYVRKLSGNRVEIFGGIRTGRPGDVVALQARSGRRGAFKTFAHATLAARGYFDHVFSLSGASGKQYRFVSGRASSNVIGAD